MEKQTKSVTVWIWVEEENEGMWRGLHLTPGKCVEISYGEKTDEGWSRTDISTELSEDGKMVRQLICSDGVDCDGRLSRTTEQFCPVEDVHKVQEDGKPPRPEWQYGKASQRDYTAESMNY